MKALDRIMEIVGACNDAELSEKTGIPAGTIGSWRNRKKISKPVQREWETKYDMPRGWFSEEDIKKVERSSLAETLLDITDKLSPEGQSKMLEAATAIFISEQTKIKE